ncbi:PEP-CTERM sorting domain-containing protein [Paucibacter sp. O1-1]|nr:PEP-CTERM sorting domain-containing protein [Paucibacter sp. O1-1]MDA3828805.1 PEP-CTERM sorting domain-containing protein [Paucibacter sp. O1-1]
MKALIMKKHFHHLAAAATLGLAGLYAQAAPIVIDVSGAQSINLVGESGNTVWLIDIGAGSVLNSLSWDVTLSAPAPSLLSELQLSFGSSSGLDLITWAPAASDGFSGTGAYAGSLDLAPLGLAVGGDGLLRLEFSEAFKDLTMGMAEGQWLGGQLSFDVAAAPVPEPAGAVLLLLGLGFVAARLRRSGRDEVVTKSKAEVPAHQAELDAGAGLCSGLARVA